MKFELQAASGDMKKWTNVLISKGFSITLDTSERYTQFIIELNSLADYVILTKFVGHETVLHTYDNPQIYDIIIIYDGYLE